MNTVPSFRPSRRGLLLGTATSIISGRALGNRAVPDDNLAYPVLITLKLKNGGIIYGSGFYINTANSVYLVTAKHVLFPNLAGQLVDADLELISYSRDVTAPQRITITTSTSLLNANGNIKPHQTRDVTVIKIGSKNTVSALSNNTVPNSSQDASSPMMLNLVPGLVIKRFGREWNCWCRAGERKEVRSGSRWKRRDHLRLSKIVGGREAARPPPAPVEKGLNRGAQPKQAYNSY
jgi:hypothetical protein